jgi:hypothetical protein
MPRIKHDIAHAVLALIMFGAERGITELGPCHGPGHVLFWWVCKGFINMATISISNLQQAEILSLFLLCVVLRNCI